MTKTRIRAAAADDWPAIWRFMRPIVAAGETFAWARDIPEQEARTRWCHEPPGRTFVARNLTYCSYGSTLSAGRRMGSAPRRGGYCESEEDHATA